ncbi:hypothetical protein THRCLA_20997 [Thraustotheca clavata]|uniref:ER membrane protein complex subunit 6 n=1 Tax=Thraustotheca clavata TaxID=74557 RepID=A0A1W0A157_9STRA|nr:hypothetical protein THRCLA_20997 [Thraustotheca clavata]
MDATAAGTEFFSMENMAKNEAAAEFTRTAMSVVSGSIAGVMGLTGLQGFGCMIVLYTLTSGALLAKMKMDCSPYFNMNALSFTFAGIGGHLVSFILFWTLAYGLVHIY